MTKELKYPFLDLRDAITPYAEDIKGAIMRVVESGRYIGGEECSSFENQLCAITGSRYCVGVSNGLDALRLIFRSYIEMGKLQKDDEVIVPANTYIASVLSITDLGLKPLFVEPDPMTFNLDWNMAEKALTERTKAVLTVHLYGRVAWDEKVADRLRKRGILIVEDNAQAIGAVYSDGRRTGGLGDAAAFSFYPTKNIGALGDAGAVTTDDESLANMVRTLANYGSDFRYHNIVQGYNCRLDPLQAAILKVKLDSLDEENKRRRRIAEIYCTEIKNPEITLPSWEVGKQTVWHQFVVQVENRNDFTHYLDANGIGWDIHYATPPHKQPCYAEYTGLHLPITELMASRVVSLPISASTSENDAKEISAILNEYKTLK